MTATYHRRFFPDDVDGTVAYVAPNDVNNKDDRAYDQFFKTVGTPGVPYGPGGPAAGDARRRPEMDARVRRRRAAGGPHVRGDIGTADRRLRELRDGLRVGVLAVPTAGTSARTSRRRPRRPTTSTTSSTGSPAGLTYTDQGLEPFIPYYYQAGTQLGWPLAELQAPAPAHCATGPPTARARTCRGTSR